MTLAATADKGISACPILEGLFTCQESRLARLQVQLRVNMLPALPRLTLAALMRCVESRKARSSEFQDAADGG